MEPANYQFLDYIVAKESPDNYGLVVDIGSHVGDFIIGAKEAFGSSVEIIAFEPDEENYKNNLRRVEFYSDVTVHPVGIFYGKTESQVLVCRRGNPGGYVIEASEYSDGCKRLHGMSVRENVTFDLVELEDVLSDSPFVVKIDCESSEYNILEHSEILKTAKYIIVEFHIEIGIPVDKVYIQKFIKENIPTHKIVLHGDCHWRHVLLERNKEK